MAGAHLRSILFAMTIAAMIPAVVCGQGEGEKSTPPNGGVETGPTAVYLSDIELYLLTPTSRGSARYDSLRSPKVSMFAGVVFPNAGIGQYFDNGYSIHPSILLPVGPGQVSPRGTFRQWGANFGFNFTQWNANNEFALNQKGGKNFDIGHAQSYTAEFGPEWWSIRPVSANTAFVLGGGINAILGGFDGETPVARFNANQIQVNQVGDPNPSAFMGGFCVSGRAGVIGRGGVEVLVEGRYSGFGSDAVTGQGQYSDAYYIGGTVRIPIGGPRLQALPYVAWLFRNQGVRPPRDNLLILTTPRIIIQD